jgi:hypothetical protein
VTEKIAARILEFADREFGHGPVIAVGPIQAPLAGLGIVQAQAHPFDATCRAIDVELEQTGAAIPNL